MRKVNKGLKLGIIIFGLLSIVMIVSNKSYALFTKSIEDNNKIIKIDTASSVPAEIATEKIKMTIGKVGGVIGVSNEGEPIKAESENIREYRYSGLDVNNYVTFNDETWRIVGIFKDENENEHLKIVRNEVIKQAYFPETYTENEIEYSIKSTNTEGDYAFWNKKVSGTSNNNWPTAGLQYWLNAGSEAEEASPEAGYMSYLSESAKGMIEDKTKYYLGTVTYYNQDMNGGSESVWGVKDTVNEAYKNERAVTGCAEGKGPVENNSYSAVQDNETCRVWANNAAIWEGKIALLYPSDYGYSADSQYWNTKLGYTTFNGNPSNSSWLQQSNHKFHELLLSPSSCGANNAINLDAFNSVNTFNVTSNYLAVRPCLSLKSNVKITGGNGTQEDAYTLFLN